MPLKLIHGPPNSGRRPIVLDAFRAVAEREPLLVVPTADDAFDVERELAAAGARGGALLGGTVLTFRGLAAEVAAVCGRPQTAALSEAQRLRAIELALGRRRERLGPLRRSAAREGFAASLSLLLDELQSAGLGPADVEAGAATLDGSAYLADLGSLFAAYEAVRAEIGRSDTHGIATEAITALRANPRAWERPVFVYGVDDLTGNQLELLAALAAATEVTLAVSFEPREVFADRARLLERLREGVQVGEEETVEAKAENTDNPLLFHLERNLGETAAAARGGGDGVTLLRSAGPRGEAEAIGAAVARLLHEGKDPAEIAIVLRDPARRGPLISRVLESYGIPTALETELPVAATGVGGALIALLEAEHGSRRAGDVLRWLRGPSGQRPHSVDWLERAVRRERTRTAADALALWGERGELPRDLVRLRQAKEAAGAIEELSAIATRMATRFVEGEGDGRSPGPGARVELRVAAEISRSLAELAELGDLAPSPPELIGFLREMRFRLWSGPVGSRVRIADPRRLRALRFDHVVIGSLQDGEFPRRGGGDPFLSDALRESLGLEPRRNEEAEERYLFYSSVSLARESLVLSYRESDDAGAAEARSPLLDDVLALVEPQAVAEGGRGLAEVAFAAGEAPSLAELARSLAAAGGANRPALLGAAGPGAAAREGIERQLRSAEAAERASRAPGPLRNPAVLARLGARRPFGGTTLERFDICSYIWFAEHELRPLPLDPVPDALVQGSLVHDALEGLFRERPGGEVRPRPETVAAWKARAAKLVAELAGEADLGASPQERAIKRGAERLLARFLDEEAGRESSFEPALLEADFGEGEENDRPALEIDDWLLHGAIDRIDRTPDGRALIHDYKVAGRVAPVAKFEEEAKLQLPLYALAAEEQWGLTPVGAVYHPLRGTSTRAPRGFVLDEEREDIGTYPLVKTDVLDRERFEAEIEGARERASRIVARMRSGEIARDPGPREGLRNHDVCPRYCALAPICRRDRTPVLDEEREPEEQ